MFPPQKMPKEQPKRQYNRQGLATGHDQRGNGRRRSTDHIKTSASCGRLAGSDTRQIKTPPRQRQIPSRSSESLGDPDNWRQKSKEQKAIEREIKQHSRDIREKAVKPKKRGKKCRGREKEDESRQEAKDVRSNQKHSGSKQSDQLITEDAADISDGRKKAAKSQKNERKCHGRKRDGEKEEGLKEVWKHRGSKDSHQLKEEKREEAKDVGLRSRKQKGCKAAHTNVATKGGDKKSDLKNKKTEITRHSSKQQHRVNVDSKSGADDERLPNTYLNDGEDLHFVTYPLGHSTAERFHYSKTHPDFSLGNATHLDWSEVPNTLTTVDLQQICSSLHFYLTNSDEFHIQGDGGRFVAPDGDISSHLHHYESLNQTHNTTSLA